MIPHRLLKKGPRLPSLVLLGIVAAALIGGVLLIWQTIDAERHQRAQAARTNAIVLALRDISRTAVNGETGQRGYFITLDRRYLAPYIAARQQYRPNLARLRTLMGNGITQRQTDLLDEIDRLNDAKFAEMEETVGEIQRGGLIEVRRRILSDEGQDVMERLRGAILGLETIELAAFDRSQREASALEMRILPMLVALLVFILGALGLGLAQVIRTANAEALAANARELGIARDRADLLARELNHRVKNLFAVVLAIVKMSGRDQPEAKPVVDKIAARIHALLTSHEVTQGTSAQRSANLADLVATALRPYQSGQNRCEVDGPPVDLPERVVIPLGLVLHELATNAAKYGALAETGGTLAVIWDVAGTMLKLLWEEQAAAPAPVPEDAGNRRGFGTSLIEGSARQLGGTINHTYREDGLTVRIEFPLAS